MSWTLLGLLVPGLAIALLVMGSRRAELARMRDGLRRRRRAVDEGRAEAQLQHPAIDLTRCLGCGTCVAACPEDGVLEVVHGQAMVVRGANCRGISACERECPTGAIAVRIANVAERDDIPALSVELEAVGAPGLFLAGEVTAHALIKPAVDQGVAVAAEVARRLRGERAEHAPSLVRAEIHVAAGVGRDERVRSSMDGTAAPAGTEQPLDLCIVGAGPAGLACALEARRQGLAFVVLEQEQGPGGTVAKYPRRKLILTEPLELPLVGRLRQTTFEKEELVALWDEVVERERLPIRGGRTVTAIERDAQGAFRVSTPEETVRARHVCMALGRRGTPRKLGVPGEELQKVAYSMIDAASYQGRRVLVVGGGDSAVEAAVGLGSQPGSSVTLSYRREAFFRLRSRNQQQLEHAVAEGRVQLKLESRVLAIREGAVELEVAGGGVETLPNDEVFVCAGGTPPFPLLSEAGVSFDPALRPEPEELGEAGSGLYRALSAGFALSLLALAFALFHLDYYGLAAVERPAHVKHDLLRPGRGLGLLLGVAGVALIALNLFYLVRRSPRFAFRAGSLQAWMTSHVATGILALLCVTLHAAMAPKDSLGGHAYTGLALLCVTGAIGRYFYAYVPRATNGRELALTEVRAQLARVSDEWSRGQREFRQLARDRVERLVDRRQWQGTFLGRVLALFGVERRFRGLVRELETEGRRRGLGAGQIAETVSLARRAHRTSLVAAHYEDLRAVLATWRYLHRWVAVLMVLLVVVHVAYAMIYGARFDVDGLEGIGTGALGEGAEVPR